MTAVGLNATDENDFQKFKDLMYNSKAESELKTLMGLIYDNYKLTICQNTINSNICAFSNLTYNQWRDSSVLSFPLPDQRVTSFSYVNEYQNYS